MKFATAKDLDRLDPPPEGVNQYIVRDAKLSGHFVVVGRKAITFTVQADTRVLGVRRSIREKIGCLGDLSLQEARAKAQARLGEIKDGRVKPEDRGDQITLKGAWQSYKTRLERRDASARTVEFYRDIVERQLESWLDVSLARLSEQRGEVAKRHDEITSEQGPYAANQAMRALRAIYNHALRSDDTLPARNPVFGIEFNKESRRDTAMAMSQLPAWHKQRRKLPNPIRREFQLLMLLTGSRPDAMMRARWEHINIKERRWHFPDPKGGKKRAFDVPLSRAMLRSLWRCRAVARKMYEHGAKTWVFPGEAPSGHIEEHKERRTVLSHWGGDLRQTYRTAAQVAGINEIDVKLLMNHKLPGVNAGYITRSAMWGHLVNQQNRLSEILMPKIEDPSKTR